MRVEIYSDIVCPWCYIGERRFERALETFGPEGVEVVFRPYQLDPTAPSKAIPLAEYLEGRYGSAARSMQARVGRVAAAEGIVIDWDRALAANTFAAHRSMYLAEREYGSDVQRRLAEELFAAHFCQGADLSDHRQLGEVAARAGLDAARVRDYLDSPKGEEEVRAQIDAARAAGIRAVPTFVFDGKYLVEGGQETATFVQVLEEVRRLASVEGRAASPG